MSIIEYKKECPKCLGEMDYYDDVENLSFGGLCKECGHTEEKDYYRTEDGRVLLLTKEEAIEQDVVKQCSKCGDVIYSFENNGSGLCIICQAGEID